jgi:hypothetical protein
METAGFYVRVQTVVNGRGASVRSGIDDMKHV